MTVRSFAWGVLPSQTRPPQDRRKIAGWWPGRHKIGPSALPRSLYETGSEADLKQSRSVPEAELHSVVTAEMVEPLALQTQLGKIFATARDEIFYDGMESDFSHKLVEFL